MGIFDRITDRVNVFIDEVMLPEEVRRAQDRAAAEMQRGEYDQALAALAPTLVNWPNIARTHHMIGMCHFHREEYENALSAFDRAIDIREEAPTHFYAALAAESLEHWLDAKRHYQRALTLEEGLSFEFDLYFGLGRVHLAMSRPDKAVRELRRALREDPGRFEPAPVLARALVERANYEEAREVLDRFPEAAESPEALVLYGRLHEALGELEEASKAYEAAVVISENDPEALSGAARTNLDLGDHRSANEYLIRALDHASGESRAEIYVLLGRANEAIHNDARATESYENALSIDDDNDGALLGAGRMKLRKDAPEEAADYFQRVVEKGAPQHQQEALWGLGEARLDQGDLAGARHLLEEALQREGHRQTEVLHALGRVALASGDAAEAVVDLREAKEQAQPSQKEAIDDDLQEALSRLRPNWDLPDALDEPVALVETLRSLRDYLGSDPRLNEFLPASQELLSAMDAPLSLAIVGEFNAGKSTLVNALLGEEVMPMGVLPTTAHPGQIRFGPRRAARIVYLDGRMVEVDFQEAKRLMKTDADDIERLEFIYPHPTLRLVNYWDTPGFNALEERHEKVAAKALEQAEAILWVLDANQVLSQTEFERIEKLPSGDERLLVVINKIDRLGPPGGEERSDAVAELVSYVEENIGDRMAGCFPLSAKHALDAVLEDDEEATETSGFRAFESFLDQRIIQRAGRIKTLEIGRQLSHLVTTLEAFQNGLLSRYGKMCQQVTEIEERLAERRDREPHTRALTVRRELVDRVDFTLKILEKEIAEALKPSGTWMTKLTLSRDDREFLLQLLAERFDEVLERSRVKILNQASETETRIAEDLDPIIRGLSLQDARSMNRRLEGFSDETRMLKLLFEERIFGRLRARAHGKIDAAGMRTLGTIEAAQSDRDRWQAALRGLLPDIGETFQSDLEDWYEQFFETTRRFCNRIRRDLELLELEAEYRYDVEDLVELV